MNDKTLSAAAWAKFAKGRALKDAAFAKALVALEQAKPDPQNQLLLLDEVGKQSQVLRKAHKDDKALAAYLDDVDKSMAKQRKLYEVEAKKAQDAAGRAEGDEEPAQLTTKMVPLLQQVRKGAVMDVMLGHAGKALAVLMSKKSITPAGRKLLVDYLGASGVKFIRGQCVFEENSHTFVMQGKASGLAKRVKAALLEQTGLRLKVRVRGESPDDIDEELADEEPADTAAKDTATTAPPSDLNAHFARLQPSIKALLGGPSGARIKALINAFAEAVKAKKPAVAEQALKGLEALVEKASTAPGGASAGGPVNAPAVQPAKAKDSPEGVVDYAKCRLAWAAARQKVAGELQALEKAVLDEYKDSKAFAKLQVGIRRFDAVLAGFAENLDDLLDDALNAKSPQERQTHHARAAEVTKRFLAYASSDPLIAKLQANPFITVSIKTSLVTTLEALSKRLV